MSGRLIGNRYRLVEMIAAGGFGEVWRAHDERLRVDVAVKRLKMDPGASPAERAKMIARAEQEARNAATLRNEPNVVAVHDVVTEDGLPWVVMRLVEGRSLAQELQTRGQMAPGEAARIALGVIAALKAAHTAGIAHRDVKPANIMLAADGQVLLADFGIAKHRADTSLTSSGMLIGSLEYMAPERFGSEPNANGAEGDFFSLGATLFEMVEGISPFRRDSVMATMAAVAFEPHPPLRHAGPLSTLIAALLAKKPGDRPGVDEAMARLRKLAKAPQQGGAGNWQTVTEAPTKLLAEPPKPSLPRNAVPALMATVALATAAYAWANFLPMMTEHWTSKASGSIVADVTETFRLNHPWTRQIPIGSSAVASDWWYTALLGTGTAVMLILAVLIPLWLLSDDAGTKAMAKAAYITGIVWLALIGFIAVFGPLASDVFKVTDDNHDYYIRSVFLPGGWLMLLANGLLATEWRRLHSAFSWAQKSKGKVAVGSA